MRWNPHAASCRVFAPSQVLGWETLDALILDEGRWLRVLRAADLPEGSELAWWCVRRGIYGLPTVEFCERVRELAAGRSVLEVAAGDGAFGRGLSRAGVLLLASTDSKCQRRKQVRRIYEEQGQELVRYHPDVVAVEGSSAVQAYRPQVVVASWGTPRFDAVLGDGFAEGLDWRWILNRVEFALLLGSLRTHRRMLEGRRIEYEILQGPDIRGRTEPEDSALFVLKGSGGG